MPDAPRHRVPKAAIAVAGGLAAAAIGALVVTAAPPLFSKAPDAGKVSDVQKTTTAPLVNKPKIVTDFEAVPDNYLTTDFDFLDTPTEVNFDAPENATQVAPGFYYHPLTPELIDRITGVSFHPNDVIGYDDLRYVRVQHYGFADEIRSGELIVNQEIADDIARIFYELFQQHYPIEQMVLVDDFGADDDLSMSANNTSAFNFRVIDGTDMLSNHAYGMAIDINPRINPWVRGFSIAPANGAEYAERDPALCTGTYCDLMIQRGDVIFRLFEQYGFSWGGDWIDTKDYQHFEKL